MSVYGFVSYYLAPLTFFFNRIDLFLLILNLMLLAMVLGLTVMGNILQSYTEQVLLWISSLFLFRNRSLKVVIQKNLQSHFKRNQKTALMLSMSVCFIIFSGSGITMQATGLTNQLVSRQGGDVVVTRQGIEGIKEKEITQFLKDYNASFPGRI